MKNVIRFAAGLFWAASTLALGWFLATVLSAEDDTHLGLAWLVVCGAVFAAVSLLAYLGLRAGGDDDGDEE
ncbi:MAG: hypothetical protein PHP45_05045 [Elusimicrobiales bacterium]|nr:hypothetical protein [Elusimicrobiales bacterium]